ncbi:MAG: flagellar M-ring protein FliF [Gammaproteobacteria bacterium]|nr:flagellar M-ring protein FliF [Gammaproteobacteria bacterium]
MATDATPRPNALLGLSRLAPWRQVGVLVAIAASVGFGVAIALWSQSTYFVPLDRITAGEASSVAQMLGSEGIEYRIDSNGLLLVDAKNLESVKALIAGSGLGQGGQHSLDFLNNDKGFGQTEYHEVKRYQHALEKHIGETVIQFQAVQAARVHLALPRRSPFLRKQNEPSASVFITLHRGRQLNSALVRAVAHTVAQAVEGLDASSVTISDGQGRLLSQEGTDGSLDLTKTQWDVVRQVESDKLRKVSRLLTPIAGANGFTAEVTVEMDFTRAQVAQETYNPDLPAARTRRVEEEESDDAFGARGVPGALSNRPAADAIAPEIIEETVGADTEFELPGRPAHRRRLETVSNELDKTVVFREDPVGTVSRISIAVVLDDLASANDSGQMDYRAWTPERIASVTEQVKSAIGFDEARGDQVSVVNTRFTRPAPISPPTPAPIWQQDWVWDMAKRLALLGFVLLMVFGVFRPLIKSLVSRDIVERETTAERERLESVLQEDVVQLEAAARSGDFERNLSAVRALVTEDPRRAANVLKDWVGEGGRS